MTTNNPMPDDPGNPENTDTEGITPEQAEGLADEAQQAQEVEIDPELEAEIDEALADIEPDVDGNGEISDLEAQLAERTEDLQRVSAEYANYRRRTERERGEIVDNAKAKVVTQLLPLLDDLDLAKQHGDLEEGPLRAFADKLIAILQGQKLEEFGTEGEDFDPEIHEAVQDLSTGEDKALGTVLRKGYRLGDRLIRNAMVIIADPVAGAGEGSTAESSEASE
ncbi:nucleotide exchange factor GrpE [Corynebacterium breve]|uniref:Protein GrpE n=1 Tax=Corynebacterium breve TaxID=3049799 RepID=A0ABY8VD82_9CORY|nr:nucleotide exchange factor GrpE [Corynebacterium breve]WIM67453.1 nucleotide exchange factor GrpE [Corynebacterium breve]